MALLSWGKYRLFHAPADTGLFVENGDVLLNGWKEIDAPKDGSGSLNPTAGDEQEAKEEGGEVVDSRRSKTRYTFEWDNFIKKGKERPFNDVDGVIEGEFALLILPEDPQCEGIKIDRCTISCQENFTSAEGKSIHYIAKVLKPASGRMVKPTTAFIAGSLSIVSNHNVVSEGEQQQQQQQEQQQLISAYYYYAPIGTIDDYDDSEQIGGVG